MTNWRERAREGLRNTAEFASKHGGDLGLTGGVIAASVAIGALATGHYSGSGEALTVAEYGSRNALTIGILHASGWFGAKAIGDKILSKMDSASNTVFDDSWSKASMDNNDPKRGASLHSFGEVTESTAFKAALGNVLQALEQNPEAKAEMVKMLKASPEAQREFMELWNSQDQHTNTNAAIEQITRTTMLPVSDEHDEIDNTLDRGPAPG